MIRMAVLLVFEALSQCLLALGLVAVDQVLGAATAVAFGVASFAVLLCYWSEHRSRRSR